VVALTLNVVPDPVMPAIDAVLAPLPESEKFGIAIPVTGSSNVTVQATSAAFVGDASARVIETTVGAVLSIVYAVPVNGELNGFAAASTIPETFDRLRRSSPFPVPVLAVTIRVVPVPVSPVIAAPFGPVDVRLKFACPTPVTFSEKRTVQLTDDALVGLATAPTMELTVGATLSACGMFAHDVGGAEPENRAAIHASTSDRDVVYGM
jgi:hypothetical protein